MNENSFEKKINPNEEILSEEKAHDLANRMRALIGIDPAETGEIEYKKGYKTATLEKSDRENRRVNKEDYEKALVAIEKLEKLAKEEKIGKEVLYEILRNVQICSQILFGGMAMLGIAFTGSPEQVNQLNQSLKASRENFVDDKKRWNNVVKGADKFGEKEKKFNTEEVI